MIEGCKHGPKSFIPQPCADCGRERVEADAWKERVGKQIARIVQEPADAAASIPRLTDLQRICNLNVTQAMAVQQYIERWVAAGIPPSPPARSAESFGLEPEMQPVVDELRWRMAAASQRAFTENETKDVLTALYQDGHVDLVLADRVAALMNGPALPSSPVADSQRWTFPDHIDKDGKAHYIADNAAAAPSSPAGANEPKP